MRRILIAAFVAGFVGGCYLRPAPPPGFRFVCQTDDDCLALDCGGKAISLADAAELIEGCDSVEVMNDPSLGVGYRQSCRAGLCEYSCDLLTFKKDCPSTEGFAFCFNGACANLCGTDDYTKYKGYESNDDFCSEPQTCIPIAEGSIDPKDFDSLSGSGGGGGGGGGGASSMLPEGAGFCGLRCDAPDAPACPPGQHCTGALCLPGCDEPTATPCADGTQCIAFAGYSSCLTLCDPAVPDACGVGNVCVPGLNVCQPSCLGEEKIECSEGFACDMNLSICIPIGLGTDGGVDTESADSSGTT
jgi:hypothetical protein